MSGVDGPSLGERIQAVRERIARACARAGRDPAEVTLVAVTKTVPAERVVEAWRAGLRDFGENRVQEAAAKIPRIVAATGERPRFHLIGHLQSNKVNPALQHFEVIHSVDSLRLLRKLAARAAASGREVEILVEVNIAGEKTKFGIAPGELDTIVEEARALPGVTLTGLMTVPPQAADPELTRPFFAMLRELARKRGLSKLSMGMTEDFEVAVEEGATYVRIGRAIFGERER